MLPIRSKYPVFLRKAISRLAVASERLVFSLSLSLLRLLSSESICRINFCLSVKFTGSFIGSFIGSFDEPVKFFFTFFGYQPFLPFEDFTISSSFAILTRRRPIFRSFSSRVFCQHSEMLCNVAHDLCTTSRFIFNI